MGKYLIVALATFFTVSAFAVSAPFDKWITKLTGDITFTDAGAAEYKKQPNDGTTEGIYAHKVARVVYDVATDLGTIAAHDLGVTLPAGAVITRSYFKIITQFVDAGSGTVAISCEDANNIKTATDITGSAANAFIEGASTGATSAFTRDIAADCNVTATVATAAQTAGKLILWIHYVIED